VGTEGDLGLAVRASFGEEEGKGRVLGGGLELRGTRKIPRRVRIRRVQGFRGEPRGELRWLFLGSPARFW
jgi:hypothetical protein